MPSHDPERVEVVARALQNDPCREVAQWAAICTYPQLFRHLDQGIAKKWGAIIIRALDAHDAAHGIARVRTHAAAYGGRDG